MKIILATRGSSLALEQARIVARLLEEASPGDEVSIRVVKTGGDKLVDVPLSHMPGKGVFVKEIEDYLLRGEAHLAVHSAKDLPVDLPKGLCLAATPKREDPRDVLISRDNKTLEELPPSAVIGTGSPRRKAQLLAFRPDLRVENIRGNLDTRIAKLRGKKASLMRYDALVVAAAGCLRAGFKEEIAEYLPTEVMLPAAGQGALAIECRDDDDEAIQMARKINDAPTFAMVLAERALLRNLGGGCNVPIGSYADCEGERLRLRGKVMSPDGTRVVQAEGWGSVSDPESLAGDIAEKLFKLGAESIIRQATP
jgi:hydroxymethylbilane synthase